MAVINGTARSDSLMGTSEDDEINGLDGADWIYGGGGADKIDGGEGQDRLSYETSATGIELHSQVAGTIVGRGGDAEGDTLTNIERVIGSAFDDTFNVNPSSSASSVIIEGRGGNDLYIVSGENISVSELPDDGIDELRISVIEKHGTTLPFYVENLTYVGDQAFTGIGNESDNIITGGAGNDTLYGGEGADQLIGGAGDDTLNGGAGADNFNGGAGYDTVSYFESMEAVTINLHTGEHSGLAAGDTYTEIEAITGSQLDDTFIVDGGGVDFDGGYGLDTIDYSASTEGVNINVHTEFNALTVGTAQGSTLTDIESFIGSAFNDTFTSNLHAFSVLDPYSPYITFAGGDGDDTYDITGIGIPTIVEHTDGGIDEMRVSVNYPFGIVLADNVENLTYVGDEWLYGIGNDGDNIIRGGAGDDILEGGAGNDTLIGGAGANSLSGGDGYDTASYEDSAVGATINFNTGEITGLAASYFYDIEAIRGSNYDDTFIGYGYGIDLDGGDGVDTVDYSTSYFGVDVEVREGVGTVGVDGVEESSTLTNIEIVIGSNSNDTFTSGADSRGTAITFEGKAGDDIYYIDTAVTPTIIEEEFGGIDEVRVSVSNPNGTVLAANVENLTYTGNDSFIGIGNDSNNVITGGSGVDSLYGGAGDDTITVTHGLVDGGDGNDLLTGTGAGFSLLGGAGDDELVFKASGSANGGEGDDFYRVETSDLVTIQDASSSYSDTLFLNISNSQLLVDRVGDDLYLHSSVFTAGDTPQEGVLLTGWFAGYDSIEHLYTSDNVRIYLTGQDTTDFVLG